MTLQPGDAILNGKYRILNLIGEGGMARVWLAEELTFGRRQVALKEPRADLSSSLAQEVEERYQREVQVCAALEQDGVPHIVRALTAEPYAGALLLVMEYMPGGDLAVLLKEHPHGLPLEQSIAITLDLLRALEGLHAHELEIVHRDIKPSNVLFDGAGRAHLADFGLAQLAGVSGRSQLQGGQHPGTPMYMAPEQEVSPRVLTPAADLYALGCVLFEMLTGQRYKRQAPGTRPSALRPEVPKWLDEIVARALAEVPWDRWQNAGEMAEVLDKGWKEEGARQEAGARREAARQAGRERIGAGLARRRWWLWAIVSTIVLALVVGWLVVPPLLEGVPTPTPGQVVEVGPTGAAMHAPPATKTPQPESVASETSTDTPTPTGTATDALGPTSTHVPTPTTPHTPTSAQVPGEIAVGAGVMVQGTAGAGLVLRAEPTIDSRVVANAAEGSVLTVLEGPEDAVGWVWWKLRAEDGTEGWASANWLVPLSLPTPSRSPSNTHTSTPASALTATPEPQAASTRASQLDAPPAGASCGEAWIRSKDKVSMVYVPAGDFWMGSETGESDERPRHRVHVDGFWIDQLEITNALFEQFVLETGYQTDAKKAGWGSVWREGQWNRVDGLTWRHPNSPGQDISAIMDHPVVQVSWNDANAYCQWAGGRLPTEAEWEMAAVNDTGWTYPWGNNLDAARLNASGLGTARVGTFPAGRSPCGAQDMAGNVWEWVRDWYQSNYYSDSPSTNPSGPETGAQKTLRGGAWDPTGGDSRSADRGALSPDSRGDTVGFRCAMTEPSRSP